MTQVFTGPPTIINPLKNQVVIYNKVITLYCNATGRGKITYQWQELIDTSWADINSGTSAEYKTRITESSQFRCVVSNEAGQITSAAMILVLGKVFCTSIKHRVLQTLIDWVNHLPPKLLSLNTCHWQLIDYVTIYCLS